jgi:hypothetical protein
MTFFQESHWQPTGTLSAEQVTYLRSVLVTHANDSESDKCTVCRVAGCRDWRSAYDQLAVAGELMAEPARWLSEDQERQDVAAGQPSSTVEWWGARP